MQQLLDIRDYLTEDDLPQVMLLFPQCSEDFVLTTLLDACEDITRARPTADEQEIQVRFIIDSGATKSVVTLKDYLKFLSQTQLPMIASAAGDVRAHASGLIDARFGLMKHEVLLEALYMPSCPVNVLSVPQLKRLGFGFSFDVDPDGGEDDYILTPRDKDGNRIKMALDTDPMTGLFYTTATIRIDRCPKALFVGEERRIDAMSPCEVLFIIVGGDTIEDLITDTVLTASDMQLLHERMGHIGFELGLGLGLG